MMDRLETQSRIQVHDAQIRCRYVRGNRSRALASEH